MTSGRPKALSTETNPTVNAPKDIEPYALTHTTLSMRDMTYSQMTMIQARTIANIY